MPRTVRQSRVNTAIHYAHENVSSESFRLSNQARADALISPADFEAFQQQTGLADLFWQAVYYQFPGQDKTLAEALAEANGYIFFMHGWNGSHRIWEKIPLLLTASHKNIVCFNLDVNGFGMSPFLEDTPSPEQCSPAAIMAALEQWLAAINLWPAPDRQNNKPFYLFVGHSMSGAALFYKDVSHWQNEVYGFYALAPALFCNDMQRQAFFKTLGLSINLPTFTAVKNALAPHLIDILGTGASQDVKNEHLRIYNQTPFGTIAQALYVLGDTNSPPARTDWERFQVALGHKDRVVGLDHMLELLDQLGFSSNQIRVNLGDHYFFSFDDELPASHNQNQKTFYDDLLAFCHKLENEISSD